MMQLLDAFFILDAPQCYTKEQVEKAERLIRGDNKDNDSKRNDNTIIRNAT